MTPVVETSSEGGNLPREGEQAYLNDSDDEATVIFQRGNGSSKPTMSYQASSPDEVPKLC